MEKAAIISDIHGNLEALTAVLDDIDSRGIREIVCLGDIIGYGPNPIECVDLVRARCSHVIYGNHDEALIKGPWGFNQLARDAIEWTQKQMRPKFYRLGSSARWRYLADLSPSGKWRDFMLAHGSPRDPTTEYVLPSQVSWPPPGMFEEIFDAFASVCFIGHTHLPGVFYEGPTYAGQVELPETFSYEGDKMLINVGSVGQPRDKNWKACYLTLIDERFAFRRLEYPLEITQKKIRAIPELDDRLADRLGLGE